MKKRFLLILLAILFLFSSCDLTMKQGPKPKIYLIEMGIGYAGTSATLANSQNLIVPLNDARGVVSQFKELCKAGGNDYEIVWYSDDVKRAGRSVLSPGRFTLTHYNSKQNGATEIVHLAEKHSIYSLQSFEKAFFSEIYSMWDETPTENDIIMVHYSGHGVDSINPDRPNIGGPALFYKVASDYKLEYYIAVNYDILLSNLDKYPSRQICIFDCCYSGASNENKGDILPRDDNELGYTLTFEYAKDNRGVRNDNLVYGQIDVVMHDAWTNTINNTYGKPRRMVINASTYAQQSLNADVGKSDPGIYNYGGFTFRLLKYLGYQITDNPKLDSAAPPTRLKGEVVSATSIMKYVYNNISAGLKKVSTPNITRSSYDMAIWDLR